jgi:hypothetical protein
MSRRFTAAAFNILVVAALASSCAGVKKPVAPSAPPPANASMWVEPPNLEERDLFYGPWGEKNAPDPAAVYKLIEMKHTGVNLGMTVKDSQDREWSVKQSYPGRVAPEDQAEVVLSRLLSAVGYHQAPVYYLPAFKLKDDFGTHVEVGGRFRLKDFDWTDEGVWNWADSPFVGTKPYQGLIVLLTMFNSTDLKASNNTLYETKGDHEKLYAVRDIGAALGDEQLLAPDKNNIDSFEKTPFILGVQNGFVQFGYKGWYKNLTRDRITPEEAKWAGDLLGRLSDKQWNDAFRAAGYEPAIAARFIAKLREKIGQAKGVQGR